MKFGIFSVADHYPGELPRTIGQLYEELLERAELADRLGLDSFWTAEHHFHNYGAIPSPPVWLAAAAGRTRRLRLGVAVSVIIFHNPLLLAEEYAMVDVVSGGRLNIGAGSGYLKHEFDGFGVPFEEKYERFDEALEVLRLAWSGEKFSHHGKHFNFNDVAIQVRPIQRPHPPIAIATLKSASAAQIGERGFPLMCVPYVSSGLSEVARMVASFRGAYKPSDAAEPAEAETICALHMHVGSSTAEAEKEARPALDRYNRTRLYTGVKSREYEFLHEQQLIAIGDAKAVAATIRRYQDAGFTTFLALMDFGGLEQKLVLRSMERYCKEVIPLLP